MDGDTHPFGHHFPNDRVHPFILHTILEIQIILSCDVRCGDARHDPDREGDPIIPENLPHAEFDPGIVRFGIRRIHLLADGGIRIVGIRFQIQV